MNWTRFVQRQQLENGCTFVHGTSRLNIAAADLTMFVDPPDAALVLGFRALEPSDPFEQSFPVWMATMRRRDGDGAIIESLQRVFAQLADEASLASVLLDVYQHAHSLGYRRLWLATSVFREPLLGPALKKVTEAVGKPMELVPTSGLVNIALGPTRSAG